ncbi:MAG: F0F1 ATP synthase subunit epsilon [Alphaproteobacteria bacterium]|nr:F0F1 ATP synthase subunit epsilon [Alphaproteobacteria bacterium]
MTLFCVEIRSPSEQVFKGDVQMIIAPGSDGDLGLLANHMPIITMLRQGQIILKMPNGTPDQSFAIDGGYLSMANDLCSILTVDGSTASDDVQR